MGNYRFRLSDMIPNAWFYKLRDMNKTRNQNNTRPIKKKLPPPATLQKPTPSNPKRQSYYYYNSEPPTRDAKFYSSPTNPKASDTQFFDPPRNSSKARRRKRKSIYKPSPSPRLMPPSSISSDCSCRAELNSAWIKSEQSRDQGYFSSSTETSPEPDFLRSPSSEFESSDIIIDMNETSYTKKVEKFDGFDSISEIDLPPILTRPAKVANDDAPATLEANHGSLSIKIVKERSNTKTQKETKTTTTTAVNRKSVSYTAGVRLRSHSPRLLSKKVQVHGRKSVSTSSKQRKGGYTESFAIVKSSFDPQKDFRESMMEMIVENNIRASKDLEELLACYLSLNSDEYHDLIVKAFEQIWFNLPDHRL
ncbi:hypothetical protein RJ639_043282 [Escallonia herrerae]|uniref:Transcription repressor n=1 Tax=Escallonia herrerae TaxID=1293975 RepID=A0AA88WCT8_9ASTE|nr:hypothetical protein RJ639_043282 [Escallonia herrerae]